jgi:hypothetical protein
MKFRMDFLHCALLALIVLLAVYTFGSFREGSSANPIYAGPDYMPVIGSGLSVTDELAKAHSR